MLFTSGLSCHKAEDEDWELYSSYLKALFRSEKITMMGDVSFCEPIDTALTKRFLGDTKHVVAIEGKAGGGRITICVKDTTAKLYSLSIGNAKKTLEVFAAKMQNDSDGKTYKMSEGSFLIKGRPASRPLNSAEPTE